MKGIPVIVKRDGSSVFQSLFRVGMRILYPEIRLAESVPSIRREQWFCWWTDSMDLCERLKTNNL